MVNPTVVYFVRDGVLQIQTCRRPAERASRCHDDWMHKHVGISDDEPFRDTQQPYPNRGRECSRNCSGRSDINHAVHILRRQQNGGHAAITSYARELMERSILNVCVESRPENWKNNGTVSKRAFVYNSSWYISRFLNCCHYSDYRPLKKQE